METTVRVLLIGIASSLVSALVIALVHELFVTYRSKIPKPQYGPGFLKIMRKRTFRDYLDESIQAWRSSKLSGNEHAVYYIDAFQNVRSTVFGETLQEEDEDGNLDS